MSGMSKAKIDCKNFFFVNAIVFVFINQYLKLAKSFLSCYKLQILCDFRTIFPENFMYLASIFTEIWHIDLCFRMHSNNTKSTFCIMHTCLRRRVTVKRRMHRRKQCACVIDQDKNNRKRFEANFFNETIFLSFVHFFKFAFVKRPP